MSIDATILTLNAGSSSLKFGIFGVEEEEPTRLYRGGVQDLDGTPQVEIFDADGVLLFKETIPRCGHEPALAYLLAWLDTELSSIHLAAAGHRIVHGGSRYTAPLLIDSAVLARLESFVPLAPLHMPHNLVAIRALRKQRPDLPQVACFDTSFHRSMPLNEQTYALPRVWFDQGIRRYGFHGLSYEYIASVLPTHLGAEASGRVIVAHLGHGASLCAMHHRRGVATTMGFTPLDGIPMATRPGALDPGIVTWLIREAGLTLSEVDDLLNHHSGLLALSGLSGDMRELLTAADGRATEAIDYFVHHTHRAIASLAASLSGIDALVFTAGIGENAPLIRERICRQAHWLGIRIDAKANAEGRLRISRPDSAVSVWRIPTNEELVIARHTRRLARQPPAVFPREQEERP